LPRACCTLLRQVELAVRFGKTLLVREADRVEPLLYPLLRRDLTHQGPRLVVQIGDKAVDFNERFRLFLASRSPRPDLPPDAAALVTLVNFTTTRSGLEGQLLGPEHVPHAADADQLIEAQARDDAPEEGTSGIGRGAVFVFGHAKPVLGHEVALPRRPESKVPPKPSPPPRASPW
jgi:hypothetical protein